MMKKTGFIIILSFVFGGLSAQSKHDFSVVAGGGLSGLNYNLSVGSQEMRLGGYFGVGHQYSVSSLWGLNTGIEFGFFNSGSSLLMFKDSYMTLDMDGSEFEFRTLLSRHNELQRAILLQIPLMATTQIRHKKIKIPLYVSAGCKVAFPLIANYDAIATLVNSGYYVLEDFEYTQQTFVGFGTFPNETASGSLKFSPAVLASAEFSVMQKLKKSGMKLYIGVNIDYGLNNIAKAEHASLQPIIPYDTHNPTNFTINSVLSGVAPNTQHQPKPLADKVAPLSLGIKLRLTINKDQLAKKVKDVKNVMKVKKVKKEAARD
ncbi:MAG: hypothetical protein LBP96_02530 [Bacteroidales bacterium]|jgi:hypothetical protein|nr:hypothetical protein [Bacteroidales bacterium]